ncbi:MAG: DUF22 domain-containing protein [Euryarchaeota archaeon]|nr:DUF22 domain-containing protein [Euryarchaeota archaeon]
MREDVWIIRRGKGVKPIEIRKDILRIKIAGVEANIHSVISDENKEFKTGEVKRVKIKKIKIPESSIILPCSYSRHRLGHMLAVSEEIVTPIEFERSVDHVLFVASGDGQIKQNELVGVITILPIEIL